MIFSSIVRSSEIKLVYLLLAVGLNSFPSAEGRRFIRIQRPVGEALEPDEPLGPYPFDQPWGNGPLEPILYLDNEINNEIDQTSSKDRNRTGRFINPMNPFDLRGNPLCRDEDLDGVCMELVRCGILSGKIGRLCRGFTGVCCRFIRSCGQRSSQEVVYWSNYDKDSGGGFLFSRSARARNTRSWGASAKNNFADPSSVCDIRIVRRTRHFCGLRLEPFIHDTNPAPADPGDGQVQAQSTLCEGTKLSVLGLGDRFELDLCTNTRQLNKKKYDFNIKDTEELKLTLPSVNARMERLIDVRITQMKCSEFTGEDLDGSPGTFTGTGFSGGTTTTEATITDGTDETSQTTESGPTEEAKPPAPPVTAKPDQPSPPAPPPGVTTAPAGPDYTMCGMRSFTSRRKRDQISEMAKDFKITFEGKDNGMYPLGPPAAARNDSEETLNWAVPNNDQSNFFYFRGEGSSNLTTRITKGLAAQKQEFPWQVAMFTSGNKFSCGGSVISDRHILTAAHCVERFVSRPSSIKFRLGTSSLTSSLKSGQQEVLAEEIRTHDDFSFSTLQNDIAVVKVRNKIKFGPSIRPVCVPKSNLDITNKLATVSGWGRDEKNIAKPFLQKLTARIISNRECKRRWGGAVRIVNSMACMDTQIGDSCKGDSGGPTVIEVRDQGKSKTFIQVGIVSFGSGSCTNPDLPGVYTRVSSFRDWIRRNMT